MSNNNHIPDPDLNLARKVGSWLEKGHSLSELSNLEDDPVLSARSSIPVKKSAAREEVWNSIYSSMKKEDQNETPVYSMFSSGTAKAWAVAASLVIIAFATLFYLQQTTTGPQLLAESGNQIEEVILADGSRTMLRPHSSLYIVEENDQSRVYSLEGEGYFTVTQNPNRIFSVQTKQGIVEVLGTRFNLRNWNNETTVYLEEGSVQLSLPDKSESVVLNPGEQSGITETLEIIDPYTASPEQFTGWLRQELVFSNRRAEDIFKELEFHFNINIDAPRQVLDEQLGGSISLESKESSLDDLATVLGGEFISEDQQSYQFVLGR